MDFYMYHGRTRDDGGPTSRDGEPVDDFGFEGPRLERCIGFHCTYGAQGDFNVFFEDWQARAIAQAQTGWDTWDDNGLVARFSKGNDLVEIKDRESRALHFFGDWGIK